MQKLLKLIDTTSRAAENLAVLLLFGFCALMLAEVVARGFLQTSLPYSWEYSSYAMAAVFFLGAGRALRTGTHVRVSLILECLPPKAGRAVDLLANLVALLIAAVIVLALYQTLSTSITRSLVSTSTMRTPLAIPQALLLAGAGQLWLDLLARTVRLYTGEPVTETIASTSVISE